MNNQTNSLDTYIQSGNYVKLKYANLCLIETNEHDLVRCIVNLLDDYYEELEDYFMDVTLSDEEVRIYRYNPKRLAYDIYGSTDFYSFILYINKMSSIKEFNLDDPHIKLIHVDSFMPLISYILRNEENLMKRLNSK